VWWFSSQISVGELHRRGGGIYYSRSPLSVFLCSRFIVSLNRNSVVGEITQGRGDVYTLVLPSLFGILYFYVVVLLLKMSGRFTGRSVDLKILSFSLYETNHVFLSFIVVHFRGSLLAHFNEGQFCDCFHTS